jgi:hypothetical protein
LEEEEVLVIVEEVEEVEVEDPLKRQMKTEKVLQATL